MRYSAFNLFKNAFKNHENWPRAWRSPAPKKMYDVIIIGGGGHGLGAAYYLAKIHGIKNVAVLEKGWLGGGNTARNTMTIRDNFIYPDNAVFHHEAVKLWHGLSDELNFNIMVSKRKMLSILMSDRDLSDAKRMINTSTLFGGEHNLITKEELHRRLPMAASSSRMPTVAGIDHPEVVIARHDAVAWGYARAADALGVDIIQNCEVTGILKDEKGICGVKTKLGEIQTRKLGLAVAGHGKQVGEMAGIELPIETVPLQAFVSTPVKPIFDEVVVLRGLNTYFMQSDKGELVMGAGTDPYPSYAQKGTSSVPEGVVASILELFPTFQRMKFMRQWAGVLDLIYDNSPIISKTEINGLYVDAAGSGGFKTTPLAAKMHADLIANDKADPLIEPYSLERFSSGKLILERASYGNR
mgnify:CR=1 FL=1